MTKTKPEFHPDADTVSTVTVLRDDVIDAAGALTILARETRKEANRRHNAGPDFKTYRAGLRASADVYDAAAARVQRAADEAM